MNIQDILNQINQLNLPQYIRPLLFENKDCENYPYSIGSTCFLVKYTEQYFIVTSKHGLEKAERGPKELLISINEGDGCFMPLNLVVSFKHPDESFESCSDYIVFRIALDKFNDNQKEQGSSGFRVGGY